MRLGGGKAEDERKGREERQEKTKKDEKRKSGHGVPCPYENLIPGWE